MKNSKTTIKLIITACVLTMISSLVIMFRGNIWSDYNLTVGSYVFNNFNPDSIQSIQITKPNDRTVKLNRDKKKIWTVGNYFNYPADPSQVSNLIASLKNLKVVQNVNLEKSDFKYLNLLSPGKFDRNATGTAITIAGKNNVILYKFIAGKARLKKISVHRELPIGRYIYVPGTKNVIFTDEFLSNTNLPANKWLSKDFPKIKNIKSVLLSKHSKKVWCLSRKNLTTPFVFGQKPEAEKLNYELIGKLINSIENFQFDSIASPKLNNTDTGLSSASKLTINTFDQSKYEICIGGKIKNYRYIKLYIRNNKNLHDTNKISDWTYLIENNKLEILIQPEENFYTQKSKSKRTKINTYLTPIS